MMVTLKEHNTIIKVIGIDKSKKLTKQSLELSKSWYVIIPHRWFITSRELTIDTSLNALM